MSMRRGIAVALAFFAAGCGGAADGYTDDHGSDPAEAVEEAIEAMNAHAASPEMARAFAGALRNFPERQGINNLHVVFTIDRASFEAADPPEVAGAWTSMGSATQGGLETAEENLANDIRARLRTIVGTHGGAALLQPTSVAPVTPAEGRLELTVSVEKLPGTFPTTSTPPFTCAMYRFRLRGALVGGGASAPIDVQLPPLDATGIASAQSSMEVQGYAAQDSCFSAQLEPLTFSGRHVLPLLFRPASD